MKNSYLALILARKGSVRLKNKNIILLGKKPLILWTLDYLIEFRKHFTDIILSSDSNKILSLANKKNVILIKRPKKFSKSSSSSEISALHSLKFYESKIKKKVSHLILFQPTSPFRSKKDILKALKFSNKYKNSRIVSCKLIKKRKKNVYAPNGSFYIVPIKKFKKSQNFVGKIFKPFLIKSKKNNIDINTLNDFEIAKKYV